MNLRLIAATSTPVCYQLIKALVDSNPFLFSSSFQITAWLTIRRIRSCLLLWIKSLLQRWLLKHVDQVVGTLIYWCYQIASTIEHTWILAIIVRLLKFLCLQYTYKESMTPGKRGWDSSNILRYVIILILLSKYNMDRIQYLMRSKTHAA